MNSQRFVGEILCWLLRHRKSVGWCGLTHRFPFFSQACYKHGTPAFMIETRPSRKNVKKVLPCPAIYSLSKTNP